MGQLPHRRDRRRTISRGEILPFPRRLLPANAGLNTPYGGSLVNLVVDDARAAEMKATAKDLTSLTLDERGLCDLELLAVGRLLPADRGFIGRADYERVVAESRLADGTLWPLPVTLPVDARPRGRGRQDPGPPRRLREPPGVPPRRGDLFGRQGRRGQGAYGSTDAKHPAVAYLNRQPGHYAAGQPRGDPGPAALRLRRAAADPGRTSRALRQARLVQGRRLPDPKTRSTGPTRS